MASHTFNVDETQLVCFNSNFKLKITCSMKLISPHGHLFPFSFIFRSLDMIISSGIWVAGCDKMEISVQVSGIDFPSLQFDQTALAESLRNTFCETEVAYGPKFHAEVADYLDTSSGPVWVSRPAARVVSHTQTPLTYLSIRWFFSYLLVHTPKPDISSRELFSQLRSVLQNLLVEFLMH